MECMCVQTRPQLILSSEHVAGKGLSRATGYNLNICHWNAEGVRTKNLELQTFLKTHNIDVCCIQETHLSPNHRFSVRGFETFRRDREHGPKGGLLTLVKNIYPVAEIYRSGDEDTEVLGIKLMFEGNPLSIYNLYSPPPKALHLHAIQPEEERWIIMGDFNSHSPSWGYPDLDPKGDEVKDSIITNQMVLINRLDEPHTYYSRAWRKASCPDLAFTTNDVAKITERHVEQQLGGSDLKPVLLVIKKDLRQARRKLYPSWNYKRANWPEFRKKKTTTWKLQKPEDGATWPKWKSEAIHRSHSQRCQRNNSQRKEERLHPRLDGTTARTSQYCQQTQREDEILPDRW